MTTDPESYAALLARKAVSAPRRGLDPGTDLAEHLFKFQRKCVAFALEAGSSGLFLDTGLGKTACELEWSAHAAEATDGLALILTPLAVARQIEAEGRRWHYPVRVIRDQSEAKRGINVCNYDRLERLDPGAFGAVALDESSILKAFMGKTTRALIGAFSGHRFRLAATATPAPNDHTELANHAEFLGVMDRSEMLIRWFINDGSDTKSWRLKGHAIRPFWDWMSSWSRMAEHPRDLGDDVPGFDLPPVRVVRHRTDDGPVTGGGLFGSMEMSATRGQSGRSGRKGHGPPTASSAPSLPGRSGGSSRPTASRCGRQIRAWPRRKPSSATANRRALSRGGRRSEAIDLQNRRASDEGVPLHPDNRGTCCRFKGAPNLHTMRNLRPMTPPDSDREAAVVAEIKRRGGCVDCHYDPVGVCPAHRGTGKALPDREAARKLATRLILEGRCEHNLARLANCETCIDIRLRDFAAEVERRAGNDQAKMDGEIIVTLTRRVMAAEARAQAAERRAMNWKEAAKGNRYAFRAAWNSYQDLGRLMAADREPPEGTK